MSEEQTEQETRVQEKPCCTICDSRKRCHVCGNQTLYACADCSIDLGVSVYVCTSCRDEHERKCPAKLQSRADASALALVKMREQLRKLPRYWSRVATTPQVRSVPSVLWVDVERVLSALLDPQDQP